MTSFMSDTGLSIKRQNDILSEMLSDAQTAFSSLGVSIDASPNSLIGNFLNISAAQMADIWQGLEEVYDAFNPATNEGKNLDDSCSLSAITRLESSKTIVNANLRGTIGTTISQGFILQCTTNNELFDCSNEIVLSQTGCVQFSSKINESVTQGKVYFIEINSMKITYTAEETDSANDVCKKIIDLFYFPNFAISQIDETTYNVISLENTTFTPVVDDYQTLQTATNIALFTAENIGEIVCPANTLTTIPTPIQGLSSATNYAQPISTGRLLESDAELRIRRANSGSILGQNVLSALKAKLLDIAGVSTVTIIENETTETSIEGVPPKAFQVIIEGGDNQEIANTIWTNKPAGIQAYGDISETISIDDTSQTKTVAFSRPTEAEILVKVSYTKNKDESFPSNGEDLIKNAIVAYGNNLGIYNDVISQRFFGSIFSACKGILSLNISVARKIDESNNVDYFNYIQIDRTEYPTFSYYNIQISEEN